MAKKKNRRSTKKRNSGQGVLKRKVLEAQDIRECVGQLGNVVDVIQEVVAEMHGGKSSKKLKIAAEAVSIAMNQVEQNTKSLAPLSGLKYASERLKLEEKRAEAIKSGGIDDSAWHQAQKFVRENKENVNPSTKNIKPSTRSSVKVATISFRSGPRNSKSSELTVPGPANGKVYSPREVLDIVTPLGKTERGFVHNELVRLRLVAPKTTKTLRDLVRIYKEKPESCPEWWGQRGRKAYASMSTFNETVMSSLGKSTGEVATVNDVQEILVGEKERQLRAKGIEPVNVKVSVDTAKNYHSGLALHENGVPVGMSSTRPKTNTRWTAERSLISAMSFALVVAATHYRVVDRERKGNFPDQATEGAKLLRDLVEEAHDGAPLYLVPPHRIMNHDDNARYFFEGTFNEKNEIVITHSSSHDKKNRTSLHVKPKAGQNVGGNLNGCRLKGSFIETADGTCGPAMFSVTNLSARELPYDTCPEGFIVMKLEGLGPGASTNPYDTSVGYLCLMRSDGTAEPDTKRYAFLRDVVLTDFLRQTREVYDNRPTGSALTEEDAAIVWMDGDLPQLKTVTDPDRLQRARENKMYSNKHSAARSATEQGCDLNNVFPQLAREVKVITVKDKDTPLKRRILEAFKVAEEEHGLNLKSSKKNTLVDTTASLPMILGKILTQDTIQKGFVMNGMIDEKSKRAPDLKAMIQETLQRDMTTEEWELCLEHFVELLRMMMTKGDVPDEEFIRRGFPIDIDPDGEEVLRNQGIKQEHMQRSKIVDNNWQIEQRNELKQKRVEAVIRKHLKLVETTEQWLSDNRECEKVIFREMNLPETTDRTMLANAGLQDILKPTVKLLKAFIFVRSHDKGDAVAGLSSKAKGKVEEAVPGADTLLRMAFDLRSQEVKLKPVDATTPPIPADTSSKVPAPECVEITKRVGAESSISDNRFTVTNEFVKDVKEVLDPCDAHPLDSSAPLDMADIQEQTDTLHEILRARLVRHVEQRINDASKRDHYSLRWAEQNLGRVAAIMVIMGHVKKDIAIAKSNSGTCVLRQPGNTFIIAGTADILEQEGCYLYYDCEDACWIRSGKVVGKNRSFGGRNKEHATMAKEQSMEALKSKFYRTYPSKDAVSRGCVRDGYFEDLKLYVGLGFSRKQPEGAKLVTKEGGLLSWEGAILSKLEKASVSKCSALKDKQLHAVGFLFELCYDLAISPHRNVSQNPGFESLLGIFHVDAED